MTTDDSYLKTHDSEAAIAIVSVDPDKLFQLGLRTWLADVPSVRIAAELETEAETSAYLDARSDENQIDLIVVGDLAEQLRLCQTLRDRTPEVPVLLLSAAPTVARLALARQLGVRGFCRKGTPLSELLDAFEQVASGGFYWQEPPQTVAEVTAERRFASSRQSVARTVTSPPLEIPAPPGFRYIDAALRQIGDRLRDPNLTLIDRAVLEGRRRELRAARWIVGQLRSRRSRSTASSQPPQATGNATPEGSAARYEGRSEMLASRPEEADALYAGDADFLDSGDVRALVFDATLTKLQSRLLNLSSTPLEIDIFSPEKKRELFATVLRRFDEISLDLQASSVRPEQLPEKRSRVLLDLWQGTTLDFFGRYYTLVIDDRPVELVDILLQDAEVVREAILDKIPQVPELLAHLLFRVPLKVDAQRYEFGSLEATLRAEYLLHNLLVCVANAVVQPLLNNFAYVEAIEQAFYDKRALSTRDIDRFRNELSWKYRWQKYIGEPKAIYESRHPLFVFAERGIKRVDIYTSRRAELTALSGIPQAITVVLEGRDALAPRLRSVVAFVGSGLVYILTQVIGRGIGLIGRGILENLGGVRSRPQAGVSSDSRDEATRSTKSPFTANSEQ
ncbi:DUF3685 domain-containing protein [Baaleninema simplex]|uniref:DUF3685 domain-containing protein n=1 Tax=Baaleninema simplex TaxID=2862350 RepID=UPI00034C72DE|nr:DUF3685 domain-containing protein [Baaleninema simplex]